jgi:hypothetical protein
VKARFATLHLLGFPQITTPDQLVLTPGTFHQISWKIGPGGKVGPDGRRLPSDTWCAVGFFTELADAELALENKDRLMPFLKDTEKSLHLLLRPFRHNGECNHLERDAPGEIFEVSEAALGGALVVLTTAGYKLGFEANMDRIVPFRHKVDHAGAWMSDLEGCFFGRAFTPHTVGYDGFTVSVWRSDEDMLHACYRAGLHRNYVDGQKIASDFDRSSFTRFRILDSMGNWSKQLGDSISIPKSTGPA